MNALNKFVVHSCCPHRSEPRRIALLLGVDGRAVSRIEDVEPEEHLHAKQADVSGAECHLYTEAWESLSERRLRGIPGLP